MRNDYVEILRLTQFLRTEVKPGDGVYVAASSSCINPDILRQADIAAGGNRQGRLNVLSVPLVDSDGYYPLGELLNARYVVMAEPFQHHLPEREQDLVRSVYDLFHQGRAVAQDFEALSTRYALTGCTASIYRRRRPTIVPVALETLRYMAETTETPPGMQPDWVVLESAYPSWLSRNFDGSATWTAHPARRGATPSTTLLSIAPLSEKTRVQATVTFHDARCRGITATLRARRADGEGAYLLGLRRRPDEDGTVDAVVPTRGVEHLNLNVVDYENGMQEYCLVAFKALRLTAAAS